MAAWQSSLKCTIFSAAMVYISYLNKTQCPLRLPQYVFPCVFVPNLTATFVQLLPDF